MEMIDDLGDYLASSGITENISKGSLPESPDVTIAVMKYPGAGSLETFGGVFGDDARLQIQVRGLKEDQKAPEILSAKVRNILESQKNFTVNSHFYMGVKCISSPAPLKKDGNHRWIIKTDYQVLKNIEVPA